MRRFTARPLSNALLGSIFDAWELVHVGELNYAAEWSYSGSEQSDELRPYFRIWVNKDQTLYSLVDK